MAKGKVHKEKIVLDPLAPMMDNGERGGHAEQRALCRQRHRKLLPLLLTDEWGKVTCQRCLTHRPKVEALPWWRRVVVWIRGRRA